MNFNITADDIVSKFTDNKVVCPICKKCYKQITWDHLKSKHKMTFKDFKEMYPNIQTISIVSSNKHSDSHKRVWKDPKYRKKQIKKLKSTSSTPEHVVIMKKISNDYWNKEGSRKEAAERASLLWEDPKYTERVGRKISKSVKKTWIDADERRSNASILASEMLKDPISNFGKYSHRMNVQDYKGVRMKSNMEVKFAKALDGNNIKWEYEIKTFKLKDNRRYTPDFYIVSKSMFVEVKPLYFIKEAEDRISGILDNNVKIRIITEENWNQVLKSLL